MRALPRIEIGGSLRRRGICVGSDLCQHRDQEGNQGAPRSEVTHVPASHQADLSPPLGLPSSQVLLPHAHGKEMRAVMVGWSVHWKPFLASVLAITGGCSHQGGRVFLHPEPSIKEGPFLNRCFTRSLKNIPTPETALSAGMDSKRSS